MNDIPEPHIFPIPFSVNNTPIPKDQYSYNISTKALGLDNQGLNYNSVSCANFANYSISVMVDLPCQSDLIWNYLGDTS